MYSFDIPLGCLGAITSCEAGVEHISPNVTKGNYIGVEEDIVSRDESGTDDENEDLDNIWKEMEFAMESCKVFLFCQVCQGMSI